MATSLGAENFKTFIINYFPIGSTTVVKLKDSKSLTYDSVKTKVGQILKIKSTSMPIFGLFIGPIGHPRKLCCGESYATLPKENSVISFQRLSFDEELERRVVSNDDVAHELIFWELKEQFDTNRILPKLKSDHNDYLDKTMQLLIKMSASNKKRFIQVIFGHTLYYWSYFYRANDCYVQFSVSINGKVCLERGKKINIAVNAERVFFLDTFGENEIASWQWCCVRSVKLQNAPQAVIKFEVFIVGSDEPVPLRMITVQTQQNEYLFSLSTYILKMKERKYLAEYGTFPRGPSIALAELVTHHKVEQCMNKCFHDPIKAKQKAAARAQESWTSPTRSEESVKVLYKKLQYTKLPEPNF